MVLRKRFIVHILKVDGGKILEKVYINKRKFIFGFTIMFFILSERCQIWFKWLDDLHIKHFLLIILCVYSVFIITKEKKNEKLEFTKETKSILLCTIILYVISIFFQIANESFKLYSLEEVYYCLAPIIFVFCLFNVTKKNKDVEIYMDIILYTGLFSFFVTRIFQGTLSVANIIKLFDVKALFIDSISAINESDLSVFFMVLTIYYAYKNKKGKMILSAVGTFLGYKRMAVLYLIIFLIINKFVFYKNGTKKEVKKGIYYVTVILFILAPYLVYYMCEDSFASWFYHKFGIDFNQFTMTRFDIINTVIDAKIKNFGLGTVTHFLEVRGVPGQTNMHNDILKIYMECGIIGTITFTTTYFNLARKNYYSYLIMLFIFIELFVAHFLGVGSVSVWILIYIAIFDINRDCKCRNNK